MIDDDKSRYQRFKERYDSGDMPWDSGITPPEIIAILDELQPGTALDLGCGTGTNVITLAEHRWRAIGIDYVEQAVEIARQKAEAAGVSDRVTFHHGDARRLAAFALPPADLVIDIGCGHVFRAEGFPGYMAVVAGALKPGGTWMLYIHHHDEETGRGLDPAVVLAHAAPHFEIVNHDTGIDTASGDDSSWFRLVRTAVATT